ncbi:MAG: type II toxin-antitoxin system VapC family toxin [Nitrospirae bacterium]|nr:type II toxin-antitoxin system VapC family toxin [Nitrospirota bacterium]
MAQEAPIGAAPVLFDTDVLIDFLRGREKARDFLDRVPIGLRRGSHIVLLELLQGARNRREQGVIERFFRESFPETHPVAEAVSSRAVGLMLRYGATSGLRPADCLIAATALVHGTGLATGNVRHYSFIHGLELLKYDP